MTTHVPQEDVELIHQLVAEREKMREQLKGLSDLALAKKFELTETVIRRIIHGGRK